MHVEHPGTVAGLAGDDGLGALGELQGAFVVLQVDAHAHRLSGLEGVDAVGAAEIAVFADGELIAVVPVSGLTRAKLPSVAPALRWAVEIVGTAVVRKVVLACSFAEAQNAG